jgi:hypothetical protein
MPGPPPPFVALSRYPQYTGLMIKLAVIVIELFLLARALGKIIPRVEIMFDGGHDDVKIFSIMREHFPQEYERYKQGLLSETEERQLYLDCIEILGARQEIERL